MTNLSKMWTMSDWLNRSEDLKHRFATHRDRRSTWFWEKWEKARPLSSWREITATILISMHLLHSEKEDSCNCLSTSDIHSPNTEWDEQFILHQPSNSKRKYHYFFLLDSVLGKLEHDRDHGNEFFRVKKLAQISSISRIFNSAKPTSASQHLL